MEEAKNLEESQRIRNEGLKLHKKLQEEKKKESDYDYDSSFEDDDASEKPESIVVSHSQSLPPLGLKPSKEGEDSLLRINSLGGQLGIE